MIVSYVDPSKSYVEAIKSDPKDRFVKVDLSKHPELTGREDANIPLRKILKELYKKRACQIHTLILSSRSVSGGAIMGLPDEHSLSRLKAELRVVDFSKTSASENALHCLSEFPYLEEAYFNDCPKVNLCILNRHQNLKVLSLIGTKVSLECVISDILKFPSLERLEYTLNSNDQAPLGLKDRHKITCPALTIPCGHVHSYEEKHSCGNPHERSIFLADFSVRILKVANVWKVYILDISREPIESSEGLFLHERCKNIYRQKPEMGKPCVKCEEPILNGNLHSILMELDSSLDLFSDFQFLPTQVPYDILRRSLDDQKRNGML